MKSQLDLIVTIVSILLAGIIVLIWFETKRTVVKPAPPDTPANGALAYPSEIPAYTAALPGGGGGAGSNGSRFGRMGGMGGGMGPGMGNFGTKKPGGTAAIGGAL